VQGEEGAQCSLKRRRDKEYLKEEEEALGEGGPSTSTHLTTQPSCKGTLHCPVRGVGNYYLHRLLQVILA